jgi:hypothetical protein
LCKELRDAYQRSEDHPGDYFPFTDSLINRADAALATPPAPPLEPRGCPLPGACGCPTAPIVPPELIRALEVAAEALRVVDAGIVLADDMAGAQACAAKALPKVRYALQTWRDHSTPPAATREVEHDDGDVVIDRWVDSKSDWISNWAAPRSSIAALIGEALEHWGRSPTREAGPLPQAGAEIIKELAEVASAAGLAWETWEDELFAFARAVWDRAVLARWGGAAVQPVAVSERLPGPKDCCVNPRNGQGQWCWGWVQHDPILYSGRWRMILREWLVDEALFWLPHWALPVPAAGKGEVQA